MDNSCFLFAETLKVFFYESTNPNDFYHSIDNDFRYFPMEINCCKLLDTLGTIMDHLKRGCRSFQLFFIDFQLFYFLTRIILDLILI